MARSLQVNEYRYIQKQMRLALWQALRVRVNKHAGWIEDVKSQMHVLQQLTHNSPNAASSYING